MRAIIAIVFLLTVLPAQGDDVRREPDTGLGVFRAELSQALRALEIRTRACEPARSFPASMVREIASLELAREVLSGALIHLSQRAMSRCLGDAERTLALAIVRYRQAAKGLGMDTSMADAAEELVWGSIRHEGRAQAIWAVLPPAVRQRLEGFESLQAPFDPVTLLEAVRRAFPESH